MCEANQKQLIVLSGNIGVGKSTLGPILAKRLGADWLSESTISSQFEYLFAEDSKESRVISQISFTTLRVATILSSFLGGSKRIVSERCLWDSWVFFELWRDKFKMKDIEPFFEKLHDLLSSHVIDYDTYIFYLTCDRHIVKQRIEKRGEVFDNNHTDKLLLELEAKYESAIKNQCPEFIKRIDVSDIDITNNESIERFVNTIKQEINDI